MLDSTMDAWLWKVFFFMAVFINFHFNSFISRELIKCYELKKTLQNHVIVKEDTYLTLYKLTPFPRAP